MLKLSPDVDDTLTFNDCCVWFCMKKDCVWLLEHQYLN